MTRYMQDCNQRELDDIKRVNELLKREKSSN